VTGPASTSLEQSTHDIVKERSGSAAISGRERGRAVKGAKVEQDGEGGEGGEGAQAGWGHGARKGLEWERGVVEDVSVSVVGRRISMIYMRAPLCDAPTFLQPVWIRFRFPCATQLDTPVWCSPFFSCEKRASGNFLIVITTTVNHPDMGHS
jgi:hypothetical protein